MLRGYEKGVKKKIKKVIVGIKKCITFAPALREKDTFIERHCLSTGSYHLLSCGNGKVLKRYN